MLRAAPTGRPSLRMTRIDFSKLAAALRLRTTAEPAGFAEPLPVDPVTGVVDCARVFARPDQAVAAQRLKWTLNAIELRFKPSDPTTAFDLIVRCREADGGVGPNNLERIAGGFARAAARCRDWPRACPLERVGDPLDRLIARKDTGDRDGMFPDPGVRR